MGGPLDLHDPRVGDAFLQRRAGRMRKGQFLFIQTLKNCALFFVEWLKGFDLLLQRRWRCEERQHWNANAAVVRLFRSLEDRVADERRSLVRSYATICIYAENARDIACGHRVTPCAHLPVAIRLHDWRDPVVWVVGRRAGAVACGAQYSRSNRRLGRLSSRCRSAADPFKMLSRELRLVSFSAKPSKTCAELPEPASMTKGRPRPPQSSTSNWTLGSTVIMRIWWTEESRRCRVLRGDGQTSEKRSNQSLLVSHICVLKL